MVTITKNENQDCLILFHKEEINDLREAVYSQMHNLDELLAKPETKEDEGLFNRASARAGRLEKLFESLRSLNIV